ncbi:MAG TPA: RNA-binding protein [Acidimicrobiia bacterium]
MANTNIYVGNLAYSTTSRELEEAFARYGTVARAQVVSDRETGRSRGFGFVEMPSADEAQRAIEALDGSDLGGRRITVNKARERDR